MLRRVHSVLVAGSDPEWLKILSMAIGEEYPVACTDCCDTVVRSARVIQPSVIVLATMMTGQKGGLAALSELQCDPVCGGIPVIMISDRDTGNRSAPGLEDFSGAPCGQVASFLENPFSAERLMREIRSLICARYEEQHAAS